jgi:hypothetical protein
MRLIDPRGVDARRVVSRPADVVVKAERMPSVSGSSWVGDPGGGNGAPARGLILVIEDETVIADVLSLD